MQTSRQACRQEGLPTTSLIAEFSSEDGSLLFVWRAPRHENMFVYCGLRFEFTFNVVAPVGIQLPAFAKIEILVPHLSLESPPYSTVGFVTGSCFLKADLTSLARDR